MYYHIDYKWYKDVPPYVSGGANLVISAHNSVYPGKADYYCSGVDDQMLINYVLGLLPDGGTIALTDGTFVLSDSIIIPANGINLLGMSQNTLIDGYGLPTGSHAIVLSGHTNCSIKYMTIRTQAGGGNNCHCIFIEDGSDNFIIDSINVTESDDSCIRIEGTAINNGMISNCHLGNADGYGIHAQMDNGNTLSRLWILSSYITNCENRGVHLSDSSNGDYSNCVISDNIITNNNAGGAADDNGIGIYVEDADYTSITSNQIIGNNGTGVYIFNSDYCVVTSNTIDNNTRIGIRLGILNHITISSNIITRNGNYGVYVFGGNINDSLVISNTVNGNTGVGIMIAGNRCNISGNQINSNTQHGIWCTAGNSVISGNTLYDNGNGVIAPPHTSGIFVEANDVIVTGNSILNDSNTVRGICLPDAENCVITGNHVDSVLQYGIYAISVASGALITTNRVVNSGAYGIYVHGSPYSVIEANTIIDSDDYEVYISTCDDVRVIGNDIWASSSTGIFVGQGCDRVFISDNVIVGYGAATPSLVILDGNADYCAIQSNYIFGSDSYGIEINANGGACVSTVVRANTIRSNALGKLADNGTDTMLPFISASFVDGSDPQDSGYLVDANTEYARVYFTIPPSIDEVFRIKIWARSVVLEADAMRLEVHVNGGASNEAYNTHTTTTTDKPSSTTNFAADDIIYWTCTDATITALQGGDSVEMKVLHEAAGGLDCATNAYFRAITVEYV